MVHNIFVEQFREQVEALVKQAANYGVIVTVETHPLKPLAMGNFALVVDARPARNQPEICLNCDSPLPEGCRGHFRDDGERCALNRKGGA